MAGRGCTAFLEVPYLSENLYNLVGNAVSLDGVGVRVVGRFEIWC